MRPNSLRPCRFSERATKELGADKGFFHDWDHRAELRAACGPLPAGVVAATLGIIELDDGRIVEIPPSEFAFEDSGEMKPECQVKPNITNFEKIKSMTKEELAEFMAERFACYICPCDDCDSCVGHKGECKDQWTKWLDQEAEV